MQLAKILANISDLYKISEINHTNKIHIKNNLPTHNDSINIAITTHTPTCEISQNLPDQQLW